MIWHFKWNKQGIKRYVYTARFPWLAMYISYNAVSLWLLQAGVGVKVCYGYAAATLTGATVQCSSCRVSSQVLPTCLSVPSQVLPTCLSVSQVLPTCLSVPSHVLPTCSSHRGNGLFYDQGTRSVSFEVKNNVFQIWFILMFLYCR